MSDYQDGDFRDEDGDDATLQEPEDYKEMVVFLVDVSESNFEQFTKDAEGGGESAFSPFDFSMEIVRYHMRSKIFHSPNDETAVLFFGAEKNKNKNNFDNVYTFLELDSGSAQRVLDAEQFTVENFREEVGSYKPEPGVPRSEALRFGLWAAGQVLNRAVKASRRVFLFTDCENPSGSSDQSQAYKANVLSRAKELRNSNIHVQVFPLPTGGRSFDLTPFWADFMSVVKEEGDALDDYELPQGEVTFEQSEERLQSLAQMVRRKTHKRRTAARLRWQITPGACNEEGSSADDVEASKGLEIGIRVYNLVLPAGPPPRVNIHAPTNEVLTVKRAVMDKETGSILSDMGTKLFQVSTKDGRDRFPDVILKKEEVEKLRPQRGAGMKLLGFKPRHCLKDHHHLSHSYFLRPNDRDVKGSVTVFKSLLDAMTRQDKVAICKFQLGRLGSPSLVALLPQIEVRDQFNVQIHPEGMHAILLPFMDDIRSPETDDKVVGNKVIVASQNAVQAASVLVDRITTEKDGDGHILFDSSQIGNPTLQRVYDVIEALALQRVPPSMEELDDGTAPAKEDMEDLYHTEMQEFVDVVYGPVGCLAETGKKSGAAKRPAEADDLLAKTYNMFDWAALITSDINLARLKIPDLKVYLQYHNLKRDGKKSDLIDRIKEHAASTAK